MFAISSPLISIHFHSFSSFFPTATQPSSLYNLTNRRGDHGVLCVWFQEALGWHIKDWCTCFSMLSTAIPGLLLCLCTRKNRNRLQQTDREVPRVFPCVFLPPLTHTVSSLSQLFLPPLIEARSNTILASRGYGALGFNSHGICV